MKNLFLFSIVVILKTVVCDNVDCQGFQLCEWENWTTWSSCGKRCGDGTQIRSRSVCCHSSEGYYECISNCHIKDEGIDTKACRSICPTGNCTFEKQTDTGIEATDYKLLYGIDPEFAIYQPLLLLGSIAFCEDLCQRLDFQDGLFCWAYTYSDKCFLYLYTKPLSLAHPELIGQSKGESVYVRHCTETVECLSTNADIVFLVDSSGSIGGENFLKMKVFLQYLVNKLDIDTDLTRVGMLVFNDKMKWEFKIGDLNNKMDVLKICQDTIDNCAGYLNSCNDEKYRGFLNERCPESCGYCQSHKTINETMVNGNKCPEWYIPTECYMVNVSPDCCPIPQCPGSSYVFTADKGK